MGLLCSSYVRTVKCDYFLEKRHSFLGDTITDSMELKKPQVSKEPYKVARVLETTALLSVDVN